MRIKQIGIGALFAACVGYANAANYTGNELLSDLTSKDPTSVINSYRYIQGVVDAEALSRNRDKGKPPARDYFCVPNEVTGGQVHDLIKQRLQKNPAIRHLPAIFFVTVTLTETYPCSGNP